MRAERDGFRIRNKPSVWRIKRCNPVHKSEMNAFRTSEVLVVLSLSGWNLPRCEYVCAKRPPRLRLGKTSDPRASFDAAVGPDKNHFLTQGFPGQMGNVYCFLREMAGVVCVNQMRPDIQQLCT